jgi:hypothetical protein
MSHLIRCPQCEMPYLPGEAAFCGNCGTKLPSSTNVNRQLSRIEHAPRPYNALRFISALIIGGGWLIIIGGWALTILFYVIGGGFLSVNGEVPVFPIFAPLIFLFVITLTGLVVIGVGQIYAVILDIRDDMNATMQYVRYGLKNLKEK